MFFPKQSEPGLTGKGHAICRGLKGINQIMWIMRPSKLVATSRSGQRLDKAYAPKLPVD
jgi:hypothetical protein